MQERSRSTTMVKPRKAWVGRNTRPLIIRGTAAFLLLVFTTISLHGNWPVVLLWVSGGTGLWGLLAALRRRRERALILQDVEAMTDEGFLRYAADLLRAQGYTVHPVGRSADARADLLLTRGRANLVCQLRRQPGRVGEARKLARREGCVLIDRKGLASLVAQYRQGHRVLAFDREEVLGLRRRK